MISEYISIRLLTHTTSTMDIRWLMVTSLNPALTSLFNCFFLIPKHSILRFQWPHHVPRCFWPGQQCLCLSQCLLPSAAPGILSCEVGDVGYLVMWCVWCRVSCLSWSSFAVMVAIMWCDRTLDKSNIHVTMQMHISCLWLRMKASVLKDCLFPPDCISIISLWWWLDTSFHSATIFILSFSAVRGGNSCATTMSPSGQYALHTISKRFSKETYSYNPLSSW